MESCTKKKIFNNAKILAGYAFFGTIYSVIYVLTFFVDPNPEKTKKENTGPYWKSEFKRTILKKH